MCTFERLLHVGFLCSYGIYFATVRCWIMLFSCLSWMRAFCARSYIHAPWVFSSITLSTGKFSSRSIHWLLAPCSSRPFKRVFLWTQSFPHKGGVIGTLTHLVTPPVPSPLTRRLAVVVRQDVCLRGCRKDCPNQSESVVSWSWRWWWTPGYGYVASDVVI